MNAGFFVPPITPKLRASLLAELPKAAEADAKAIFFDELGKALALAGAFVRKASARDLRERLNNVSTLAKELGKALSAPPGCPAAEAIDLMSMHIRTMQALSPAPGLCSIEGDLVTPHDEMLARWRAVASDIERVARQASDDLPAATRQDRPAVTNRARLAYLVADAYWRAFDRPPAAAVLGRILDAIMDHEGAARYGEDVPSQALKKLRAHRANRA